MFTDELTDALTEQIKNLTMAPTAPTTPTLRREYLDMIPEFSGNSKELSRFIDIAEKLINKFYIRDNPQDFQNDYLIGTIRSKIIGEASDILDNATYVTWDDIKRILKDTYKDKRDMYTLNIEMTNLRQGNETPFDFYHRLQELLNLQIAQIKLEAFNQIEVLSLQKYVSKLALRVLLRGLKDPVGSLMRTKNPDSLQAALNMLTNDFNIETQHNNYTQQRTQKNKFPPKPIQKFNETFKPPQTYFRPNFNSYQKPYNPQFHNYQKFGAQGQKTNQTTYRYNGNFSRPHQDRKSDEATPMSISTKATKFPNQCHCMTEEHFLEKGPPDPPNEI